MSFNSVCLLSMRRHPSNAQTQPFTQFQNRPFVRRGEHFFRRFFNTEPSVSDVFVGLQNNHRIARDFGRKDVFAVFKHTFRIAVPPVVVDFVNRAVVPVAELSVRKADAGFLPNFTFGGFLYGFVPILLQIF